MKEEDEEEEQKTGEEQEDLAETIEEPEVEEEVKEVSEKEEAKEEKEEEKVEEAVEAEEAEAEEMPASVEEEAKPPPKEEKIEEEEIVEERIYTIPLGRAWIMPANKRAPRAMRMIRSFVTRHMKLGVRKEEEGEEVEESKRLVVRMRLMRGFGGGG